MAFLNLVTWLSLALIATPSFQHPLECENNTEVQVEETKSPFTTHKYDSLEVSELSVRNLAQLSKSSEYLGHLSRSDIIIHLTDTESFLIPQKNNRNKDSISFLEVKYPHAMNESETRFGPDLPLTQCLDNTGSNHSSSLSVNREFSYFVGFSAGLTLSYPLMYGLTFDISNGIQSSFSFKTIFSHSCNISPGHSGQLFIATKMYTVDEAVQREVIYTPDDENFSPDESENAWKPIEPFTVISQEKKDRKGLTAGSAYLFSCVTDPQYVLCDPTDIQNAWRGINS